MQLSCQTMTRSCLITIACVGIHVHGMAQNRHYMEGQVQGNYDFNWSAWICPWFSQSMAFWVSSALVSCSGSLSLLLYTLGGHSPDFLSKGVANRTCNLWQSWPIQGVSFKPKSNFWLTRKPLAYTQSYTQTYHKCLAYNQRLYLYAWQWSI